MLDLFAGSGALGLEALSRGAESVTFVDDTGPPSRGKANLAALAADAQTRRGRPAVPRLRIDSDAQYDLVFLDPPYRHAERLAQPCRRPSPPCWRPGRWPWPSVTDGRL